MLGIGMPRWDAEWDVDISTVKHVLSTYLSLKDQGNPDVIFSIKINISWGVCLYHLLSRIPKLHKEKKVHVQIICTY